MTVDGAVDRITKSTSISIALVMGLLFVSFTAGGIVAGLSGELRALGVRQGQVEQRQEKLEQILETVKEMAQKMDLRIERLEESDQRHRDN